MVFSKSVLVQTSTFNDFNTAAQLVNNFNSTKGSGRVIQSTTGGIVNTGAIHFNASIVKKSHAKTASLQRVSTDKGNITFDKNTFIISKKGALTISLQTKGSISIHETEKIATRDGAIRLEAFEQKARFSKEFTNAIAISDVFSTSAYTKSRDNRIESDVIHTYPSAEQKLSA
jgi:hypothetical protein